MPHRFSESGFSLLEVLIALAIASSIATGIAVLTTSATSRIHAAREQSMAAVLAGQRMEQLKAQLAGSSPAAGGSIERDEPGFVDRLGPDGAPVDGLAAPSYIRRWSITPHSSGLCVIQVSVTGARLRVSRPAEMMTMGCQGGL